MEDFFLKKEIIDKKKSLEKTIDEIKKLNGLIKLAIEDVNSEIEEIEVDLDVLSIPKFKGQTVFERYIETIENRKKGRIRDKRKIRGVIEKNEIIKMKKDINKLKDIVKGE